MWYGRPINATLCYLCDLVLVISKSNEEMQHT